MRFYFDYQFARDCNQSISDSIAYAKWMRRFTPVKASHIRSCRP